MTQHARNSGFGNAWGRHCFQLVYVIFSSLRHYRTLIAYRTCMHIACAQFSLQINTVLNARNRCLVYISKQTIQMA